MSRYIPDSRDDDSTMAASCPARRDSQENINVSANDTKPAIQCAAIWGNLVALIGGSLPLISVELVSFQPSPYTRLAAFGLTVVGIVLSTYGRVVDTKKISGVFR